jgi:hypothetical protein
MLALVILLLVVVALICVILIGLLRSHADIVRSLHSLGVGVGDPSNQPSDLQASPDVQARVALPSMPPLPAERSSGVHDIEGTSTSGEAVVVSVAAAARTLLVFLTSGCSTCARLWASLAASAHRNPLPADIRIVVVTKGPDWESPSAVAERTPIGINVVMSTPAWTDYEVPGSPYFVLVDGERRLGEGVGHELGQVADLVGRANADAAAGPSRSEAFGLGLTGADREAFNDDILRGAGILPGHPSLYPARDDAQGGPGDGVASGNGGGVKPTG